MNDFPCPNCSHWQTVPDDAAGSLTCPRCGANVLPPDPDREMRRDRPSGRVWMVLLAVAGGLGIGLTLFAAFAAASNGLIGTAALLVGGLVVIFLIGLGFTVRDTGERRPGRLIGAALYRSLAIAGAVFLLLFTVCIAFGIYFLATCFTGRMR